MTRPGSESGAVRRGAGAVARAVPYLLTTLVGLAAVAWIEQSRRRGLAEANEAEARLCEAEAARLDRQGRIHLAAAENDQAAECFRAYNIWNYRGQGHDRLAREYRRPFWEAWFAR